MEAMNSVTAANFVKTIQYAFSIIAILQLTAYQMPPQAVVQDGASFDYIVVGAGTAGSVVAARLAEHKKTNVLLIEAGGDPPLECSMPGLMIYLGKSSLDWGYTTEDDGVTQQCHKNHVADLLMGKTLGGTSSVNFLLTSEGNYRHYNYWAFVTNDESWSWTGVSPYFKSLKSEQPSNFHSLFNKGIQSFIKITEDLNNVYLNSFEETGNEIVQEYTGEKSLGYTRAKADGPRQNTAYTYLSPIKEYTNLYVLKNTVAKKILFDDRKNAIGVEVVTKDGVTMKLKTKNEIIVSAGAINSPKLLMLSGIGPKEHLESKGINVVSDLPVGQNFQDHVAAILIHNMTKLKVSNKARDPNEYPAQIISGFVNLDKTKDYPEYSSVSFVNEARYLIHFCTVTYGLSNEICDAMFSTPSTSPMVFSVVANLMPKSRGEVLLRSTDYTESPIINTGFYSDVEDLEDEVKYIEDFIRITETIAFKNAGGELVDPNLASCAAFKFATTEYWRCYAMCMMSMSRHYAGTNAMGAVVDSKLKVMGVNNLRVADASIMPIITSGGTNTPTIMIGEKAADFIKMDQNMNVFDLIYKLIDIYYVYMIDCVYDLIYK